MNKDEPCLQLTLGQQQYILNNPYGIVLLMDHEDLSYTEYESVCEDSDIEPWPTKRYEWLKNRGKSIILEDEELWSTEIKEVFGL